VKRIGLAVLMATLTPAVYAAGYTEVCNPPEARATAPHRVGGSVPHASSQFIDPSLRTR
jgi:hypothetical protein